MVFKSDKQRRGFFATGNFKRSPRNPTKAGFGNRTAFSYRDGKKLGKFNNLEDIFKRFPSERKAFKRVIAFRNRTGKQVNTIEDIKKEKRKMNNPKRWDR